MSALKTASALDLSRSTEIQDRWIRFFVLPGIALLFPLLITGPHNHPYLVSALMAIIAAFIIWEGNRYFNIQLRRWLRWEKYPRTHIIAQCVLTLVIASTTTIAIYYLSHYTVYSHRPEPAVLRQMVGMACLLTLMLNAVYESLYFSRKWRLHFLRMEVLKRENLRGQFESLKHQVNPHFLFNSLNTLTTLIEEDSPLAKRFVDELASVYRYVLDSKNWKLVPVPREVEFCKTYVFLLIMRFGDNFKVELNISNDKNGLYLPPLTLQILLENAVKHNIINKDKPLLISIFNEDNFIVVRNNLQKKNVVHQSTGIGLSNIKARYRYLTNQQVHVLQSNEHFEVRLPLISAEEAQEGLALGPLAI